jgi:Flp pilus assembly protein TadG
VKQKFLVVKDRNNGRAARAIHATKDERGSLSILTFSLFLLLVFISFMILNTSSAYLAKRELIQIGEVALTRAAHHLDTESYYGQGYSIVDAYAQGSRSPTKSNLPIDCAAAYQSFTNELARSNLRSNAIGFNQWRCDGKEASASITSQVPQLLSIPFLNSVVAVNGLIPITTTIATTNRLQS